MTVALIAGTEKGAARRRWRSHSRAQTASRSSTRSPADERCGRAATRRPRACRSAHRVALHAERRGRDDRSERRAALGGAISAPLPHRRRQPLAVARGPAIEARRDASRSGAGGARGGSAARLAHETRRPATRDRTARRLRVRRARGLQWPGLRDHGTGGGAANRRRARDRSHGGPAASALRGLPAGLRGRGADLRRHPRGRRRLSVRGCAPVHAWRRARRTDGRGTSRARLRGSGGHGSCASGTPASRSTLAVSNEPITVAPVRFAITSAPAM